MPEDEWQALWLETAHQFEVAWADDKVLTRIMTLPWSELPGGEMLDTYLNEVVVHTWDLAVATGQDLTWDDDVVTVAFRSIEWMGENRQAMFDEVSAQMPEDQRPTPPPFLGPVPVPADAPMIDRLVAWNGRQPRQ